MRHQTRFQHPLLLLAATLIAVPGAAQLTSIGSQFWDQDSPGVEGGTELGDDFGRALATGDFNCDGFTDLAIGVPYEDVQFDCNGDGTADPNECVEAGAVQIIYGSELGLDASAGHVDQLFTQASSGVPGSPEAEDHFGLAVAAVRVPNSECDDLAVGAPDEDITGVPFDHVNAGAVFYFRGTSSSGLVADGDFVQGQDGVPDLPEDDDRFGASLSPGPGVADDNPSFCDSIPGGGSGLAGTLAIGAPGEDLFPGFDDEGTVIVVVAPCQLGGAGSGDLPSHYHCGFSSTAAPCQVVYGGNVSQTRGGIALAGRATLGLISSLEEYLAIGAPGAGVSGTQGGRVEILQYDFPNDIPYRDSCAQGTDGAAGEIETGDDLGAAIALGDFDGDGFVDLATGAPFEDVNGNNVLSAGGVSVFYAGAHGGAIYPAGGGPPPGEFFDQDETHFDTAQTSDHFGESLASGDFNHDGRDDLVIGVPDENLGSDVDAGMLHVLYGSTSGLSSTGDQAFDLDDPDLPGDSQANDHFAQALASGDFDGDGKTDLAASAPGTTNSATSGGGIFVLYGGLPGGFLDAVDFDRSPSSFSEAAGTITITVERTGSVILPLDVAYTRFPGLGTATVGVDFVDFGGNLHWNAGDRSDRNFTITILNDAVDEPNETIVLGIDAGGVHCQEPANWSLTITDNDPDVAGAMQFSTASQSISEHGGALTVTVNRVGGTTNGASVHYATADVEALAGHDYVATSGTLTFAQNQLSANLQVTILDDPWDEANLEHFTVTLSQPGGGATLGSPTTQTVTIIDDADTGIFGDGFESGSTNAWDLTVP